MKSIRAILLFLGLAVQPALAQTVVKYVHTDALGSIVAMTDESGAVIETTREYEPYGLQMVPSVQNGPGYTGHVQDAATGLTYMQQRYYDPVIGAMLSVDPVTAYEQPVTNFCRYCYARNNPYKFIDPDGREAGFTYNRDGSMHHMYMDQAPNPAAAKAFLAVYPLARGPSLVRAILTRVLKSEKNEVSPQRRGTDTGNPHAPGDVPNQNVVVRGGTSEKPDTGTTYSGSQGRTVEEAGRGVPNGQLRETTAGRVRESGGQVEVAPEPSRSGNMNYQHVNVREGGVQSTLGPVRPNPAPKPERIK